MKNVVVVLCAVAIAACSREAADGGSTVAATAHPTSAPATRAEPASAAAKHMAVTLGRCAFSFDTTVPLAAATDNTSDRATFTGPSDMGFAAYREEGERAKVGERSLEDLVKKAERAGKVKWLEKKTSNGSNLAVWDEAGAELHGEEAIEGEGVATASTSALRCSFKCNGPRARQKDVVDLCASVRVTVK
jgi:hypothetical protein